MKTKATSGPLTQLASLAVTALVILIATTVGGCSHVPGIDTSNQQVAADVLLVDIPESATEIESYTDSSAQGNCTDLSFLLPTAEWQHYVAKYYPGQLTEAFDDGSYCNDSRLPCEERPAGKAPQRFESEDYIRVNDASQYRALVVVSECFPGLALLAWMTSAI